MSTVGLSFGSPTSGSGFDVSATVSTIVSNLEKVETPWKTELSALESQDTVISSLGTLISNLSNDLSSLTDFDGVLAEKEGSSSNNNIVELTSATSSAVAGTHTIVVNSLAHTSSGYLPELTNSSTTLSGSITLQVGSGTAQTITLDSSDNTLSGLASAINSAGIGITASVLTDATGSRLSLVSGTSGANGNITVTSDSLVAATQNTLGYTGTAGTSTTTSTGTLAAVSSATASLSGSMTIQVGSGTAINVVIGAQPSSGAAANTIYTGSGADYNTLQGLADAINANTATLGATASVISNSDGTESLQLTSNTAGSDGTLTVSSSITDPATALSYTTAVTGSNASLTVDGVNLTSTSNTVSNLIPGVTMQLLSSSSESVEVIIGNYNSGVESTLNQFVSDYNSLISAINTQEGTDSSGNAEPLYGSPTLSLLQQQIMSALNMQNPTGYLTSVTSGSGTTLSGSMTIQVGSGTAINVVIGAQPSSGAAANTIYTGSGSDYNTLQGLADAINAAAQPTTVGFTANSDGTGGTITASSSGDLEGTLTITDSSGNAQTIYLGDSSDAPDGDLATDATTNTLDSLETYINDNSSTLGVTATITDNGDGTSTLTLSSTDGGTLTVSSGMAIPGELAMTAGVTTSNGQSTLTLNSLSAGSTVSIKSQVVATTDAALSFTTTTASSSTNATASVTAAKASDALAGSMTVQVGSGTAQTISMSDVSTAEGGTTLADVAQYINANTATLGVTATVVTNSSGTSSLKLTSSTAGSDGNLTMTSSLLDTTNTSTTNLSYTSSSDIPGLTGLGISVNNDGTISFDVSELDSTLNTDFSGVVGFFQNLDSWGQNFSTILTNAGTSSTTGLLALASKSNSNIESTLNADISREESLISVQQASLTAELNSANEILQELPSQLSGINELYSAITGYNESNS